MSFDPTLATDRDKARSALGDTGTPEFMADETYDAWLTGRSLSAGIRAIAGALWAKYSQMPDKIAESGGVTLEWKDRLGPWKAIAEGGDIPGILDGRAPRSGQIVDANRDLFR